MAAGLGVVLLTNRMGETEPLVGVAQTALTPARAVEDRQGLLELPERNDPAKAPDADAHSGNYEGTGRAFSIAAGSGRLRLSSGGDIVLLERQTPDCFHVPQPDLAHFLPEFERLDGSVVAASYGPEWYGNDRYPGPVSLKYPSHWDNYFGHYRARNQELSNFRVSVRKGALTLSYPWGNTEPLLPLGKADFRIGLDERSP